jgi:hypothetical protein
VTNFLDTAHLHANLKVNMKTGQPCRLNAIVPAGAKRHKKNASFLANVSNLLNNNFVFQNSKLP